MTLCDHTKEARSEDNKDEREGASRRRAAELRWRNNPRFKEIRQRKIEDGVATRISRVDHYLKNIRFQAS